MSTHLDPQLLPYIWTLALHNQLYSMVGCCTCMPACAFQIRTWLQQYLVICYCCMSLQYWFGAWISDSVKLEVRSWNCLELGCFTVSLTGCSWRQWFWSRPTHCCVQNHLCPRFSDLHKNQCQCWSRRRPRIRTGNKTTTTACHWNRILKAEFELVLTEWGVWILQQWVRMEKNVFHFQSKNIVFEKYVILLTLHKQSWKSRKASKNERDVAVSPHLENWDTNR